MAIRSNNEESQYKVADVKNSQKLLPSIAPRKNDKITGDVF